VVTRNGIGNPRPRTLMPDKIPQFQPVAPAAQAYSLG